MVVKDDHEKLLYASSMLERCEIPHIAKTLAFSWASTYVGQCHIGTILSRVVMLRKGFKRSLMQLSR